MKKLIIANWKANITSRDEISQYFSIFGGEFATDVVFCPSFVHLTDLIDKGYKLGGQNCFWEEKGAYTGEITALMLKDIGCEYVILGHSERRNNFNETDTIINAKIKQAIAQGLKVVYCIGENKGQDFQEIITNQLEAGLKDIDLTNIIIAYEPVWAIGTGDNCNPEIAKQVKQFILEKIGKDVSVIYGGSVNSTNAKDYLNDFDGLLVGGSSCDPAEFMKICS